jgi:GTPase SAR1 family protein
MHSQFTVVVMGYQAEFDDDADDVYFKLMRNVDDGDVVNKEIGEAIKNLWANKTILKVWDRRHEFQVIDSVAYYFNEIERISQKNYIPTVDDVLHARVRTSGIVTESYTVDRIPFEMYDVGGQRNERKKWIHCFEGVTAVIFVAALSEYDQTLYEDTSTNRMVEALDLFADICNNVFFLSSSMILFLNKSDLFREKVKNKNIRDQPDFADYGGEDGDYEAGVAYFKERFLARNKTGSNKKIYVHITCATDSKNVRYVFDSCKDILLRNSIKDTGFDF